MPVLKRLSRLCRAPLLAARRDCRSSASDPPPLVNTTRPACASQQTSPAVAQLGALTHGTDAKDLQKFAMGEIHTPRHH